MVSQWNVRPVWTFSLHNAKPGTEVLMSKMQWLHDYWKAGRWAGGRNE